MEYVDVVDTKNKIIGNTSRDEAHTKGLLHRVVIAEVIDSHGRQLMVRQSSDRQDAGQFVSPVGGHIENGEDPIDALKRETLEELNIKVEKFKYLGKAIFNRHVIGRKENHYFMLYEVYSDQIPTLNKEAVEYRYFTQEELHYSLSKTPRLFGDAFHFVVDVFYQKLRK